MMFKRKKTKQWEAKGWNIMNFAFDKIVVVNYCFIKLGDISSVWKLLLIVNVRITIIVDFNINTNRSSTDDSVSTDRQTDTIFSL